MKPKKTSDRLGPSAKAMSGLGDILGTFFAFVGEVVGALLGMRLGHSWNLCWRMSESVVGHFRRQETLSKVYWKPRKLIKPREDL